MNIASHLTANADVMNGPTWHLPDTSGSAALERTLKTHRRGHRAGSMIELEGGKSNVTYCVLSGWLSLSKSMPDGQRQIIDFALPGDILNPTSADNASSTLQIEAVTYTTVSAIPRNIWGSLTDGLPQLSLLENRIIAGTFSRFSERMLRLGKGSAEARIAYALIELYIRLSAIGQVHGDSFHLPLTQQTLGEFVGLSSVHVCRMVRRLSRLGVISMEGHMAITILDMGTLANIAGIDPGRLENSIIPRL
ncbi:cAMP-binding domain of CRP or a regulatory subunit of cAMP-dependent protein kinases [Jannaschia faecimaris]|uniref:cAMP-binding domain of CRP or a regulatory subunit of cAMP-dependent protein kinases n=1 Tax=Jannaschia faecimaris TaxID=1244108 RepID=A0A1H3UDT3_9RHOB|nr:Crp/Fnr family transcriptional regulator [Jannaschia faecimaris]SDZ60015.1 cAMP-binding domain of CRP or a regulatory subunit of cAMP-dependent protein kinases [Jannaschia faecimaris]